MFYPPDFSPGGTFVTWNVHPHTMDDSLAMKDKAIKLKSFLISFFGVNQKGTLNKCDAHENS